MVHFLRLHSQCPLLSKKFITKLLIKIWHSLMLQLNANAIKCLWTYLSLEKLVKTFGMEFNFLTNLKIGEDSFKNLEHIMFTKWWWVDELYKKFNIHLRAHLIWKAWKLMLTWLPKPLSQNIMQILHLIIINMKLKSSMFKVSLKVFTKSMLEVSPRKQEKLWTGKS